MKKIILPLLAALLATACVKHEAIEFEGIVVGIRNCSSMLYDPGAGYVIQLTKPEGVGGTLTSDNGETMTNLVVLYEPDSHIMADDRVHGTFYWDEQYSRANCTFRWDKQLPEGVFIKVRVD